MAVQELDIRGLKKKYDRHEVLRGVDFQFEGGKIYGLLGRNGAGKTTFFRCLIQDLPYEAGSLTLRLGEQEQALRSDDVALVPSEPHVPVFLTGYEFLKFFIDYHQPEAKRQEREARVQQYLDLLSLSQEDAHKLMGEYSHGMKNKLLTLANILLERPVLLLDEPLSSVDVVAAEEIKEILREHKREKITILSTHLLDLALDLCDEIVLLRAGQMQLLSRESLDNSHFRQEIVKKLREEDKETEDHVRHED